ncbi:MAG: MOSC domain-containing protein [Myxococcales bacterium]|nr:MOSC domain-containing protein [Myxococcales bacterium]
MADGEVVQVNVNPAGGVPKHPVAEARCTVEGVVGDLQRDLEHHGGPRRALCLFAVERIDALAAEGHPLASGTAGENLTLRGLEWDALGAGVRLAIGDALVIEITSPAPPCSTIAGSFEGGAFTRISEKLHPGWSRLYARVLVEGVVRPGDRVRVLAPAS